MVPESFEAFGKYLLLKPIAQGGMGQIHLAYDMETGMLVALKRTLAGRDQGLIQRFTDEQNISMRLRHPNLLRVHETGQIGETLYLAMEWISGRTLWEAAEVNERKGVWMNATTACTITRKVCRALEYAHGLKGLSFVHRDVSMPNIMITFDGRVRLLDYGLAWSSVKQTQTATHAFVGNPIFSAPEQWKHETVDARTDIYCLASVLWSLLSGLWPRDPYHGDGKTSLITPLDASLLGKDAALSHVIERATAEDPKERYQNAAEFGQALDEFMATRIWAPPLVLAAWMDDLFPGARSEESRELATLRTQAEVQAEKMPMQQVDVSVVEPKSNKTQIAQYTFLAMILVLMSFCFGVYAARTWMMSPAIAKASQSNPALEAKNLPTPTPAPLPNEGQQRVEDHQVEPASPGQPRSLSKTKPDISQILGAAEAAYEAGRYAAAKRLASDAVKQGATIAGKLLRAKSALKLGEVSLAKKDYLAVIAIDKDNHEAQSALEYLQKNQ